MQVVLLERIEKLGQMGDVVTVKDGYARNYLLPQRKALRATKENLARFEAQRTQLEARNLEAREEAQQVAVRLDGQTFAVLQQAGDTGQLYGSVAARDVAKVLTDNGFTIDRRQVSLDQTIKTLGLHPVRIYLHPEVPVTVTINVARTEGEAERQAAGLAAAAPEEEAGYELDEDMIEAAGDDWAAQADLEERGTQGGLPEEH